MKGHPAYSPSLKTLHNGKKENSFFKGLVLFSDEDPEGR